MINWYEYIVRWFNEDKSDEEITNGLTYGSDMTIAMQHISDYYGKDNIFSVKIHELDDFSCFDFKDYKDEGSINRFFEAINVELKIQV